MGGAGDRATGTMEELRLQRSLRRCGESGSGLCGCPVGCGGSGRGPEGPLGDEMQWRIQGAGAVAEAGGGVCGGATGKTGARAPRPVCWDRVGGSVSPRQPGVLARPGQGVVRWVR